MVGVFFLQIVLNSVIFSFIFWILTYLAKYTYSNKFYNYKLNFYECGFKNITKVKTTYEVNFILVLLFLLIYDGEFLILIPLTLYINFLSFEIIVSAMFFIIWFIITLVFDYAYHALEWQI